MKYIFLFLLAIFISCEEKQETYKEFSKEIPVVSKEEFTRYVKKRYPFYQKYEDSILFERVVKTYPSLKKILEHNDTLKVKMELTKIDVPQCNSCYEIFWRVEKLSNDSIDIISIEILSQNEVRLLNLCDNCKWENRGENMIVNGKKTIESIDIWNKLNKISFKYSIMIAFDKIIGKQKCYNEFGEEDVNGIYNEFGEFCKLRYYELTEQDKEILGIK